MCCVFRSPRHEISRLPPSSAALVRMLLSLHVQAGNHVRLYLASKNLSRELKEKPSQGLDRSRHPSLFHRKTTCIKRTVRCLTGLQSLLVTHNSMQKSATRPVFLFSRFCLISFFSSRCDLRCSGFH